MSTSKLALISDLRGSGNPRGYVSSRWRISQHCTRCAPPCIPLGRPHGCELCRSFVRIRIGSHNVMFLVQVVVQTHGPPFFGSSPCPSEARDPLPPSTRVESCSRHGAKHYVQPGAIVSVLHGRIRMYSGANFRTHIIASKSTREYRVP